MTTVPVRINVNVKAQTVTVEELREVKRGMTIISFRHVLDEIERDLWRYAEAEGVQKRLGCDPSREYKQDYWVE